MNVKFSFDKAAIERRGHTLEDVHRTIKICSLSTIFPASLMAESWLSKTRDTTMTSPLCGTLSCLCCGLTGSWTARLSVSGRKMTTRRTYSPRPKRKCKVLNETPRIPTRNIGRVSNVHPPCRFTAWEKSPPHHRCQKRNLCCFRCNGNAIPVAVNKNRSSSEGKPRRWRGQGPRRPLAARAQASRKCTFCAACRGNPLTPMPPAGG